MNPFEMSIKKKIEENGVPLSEWDVEINYGIKTGCNEAFVIDKQTRERLISEDPKSAELIRPLLRGKDIKRYGYDFAEKYLICIPCGFTNKHRGTKDPMEWFKSTYFSIYNHFIFVENSIINSKAKRAKGIIKRTDKGDYWWELRACNYMEDFNKQKLVWTPVNSEYKLTVIPNDYILLNSLFMIVGEDLLYLCGILNSSLYQNYFKIMISNGSLAYGSAEKFKEIPILNLPLQKKKNIIDLVRLITKSNDVDEKNNLINNVDNIVEQFLKII